MTAKKNNPKKMLKNYDSNDRDATLKLIDWFDIKRVRAAKVLVVGAGAIGNEVLKNLALLGFGNIFIFDRDTVEKSNLSRSILFRESDAGLPKAEVAAKAVKEINPNLNVRWKVGDIRFDLGLGFLSRMDAIIAGFDNVIARQRLNRLCWLADRPWVDAGIGVLDGQVSVYSPVGGACYECYNPPTGGNAQTVLGNGNQINKSNSCHVIASKYEKEGKIATTSTIASIVAGIQVQEALKLLNPEHWKNRNLISKKLMFNGTSGQANVYPLSSNENCSVHINGPIASKKIVKLPDLSFQKTTVKQLLSQITKEFGKNNSVELSFELIVEVNCPNCKTTYPVFQSKEKIFREDIICKCGWQPEYEDQLKFMTNFNQLNNFAFKNVLLKSKLRDINIPPLQWIAVNVPAKSGKELEEVFVELTGDDNPDLNFNLV